MGKVEDAIEYARGVHEGQLDKQGAPYIGHPMRVVNWLTERTVQEDILVAAALHDTVEDGDDPEQITQYIEEHFGAHVRSIVLTLTHRPTETYREYIERVRLSGHEARMIKRADLMDNTNESRGPIPAGLKKRYYAALRTLA